MVPFICTDCSKAYRVGLNEDAPVGATEVFTCKKGDHVCMKGTEGWVIHPIEEKAVPPSPDPDAPDAPNVFYILWTAKNGKKYPDASISIDEAEEIKETPKVIRTDTGARIKPVDYQVITEEHFLAAVDK